MASNIQSAGVDLDTLFASHVLHDAASPTGLHANGVDIQTRYDVLSSPARENSGARIPAVNVITSSTGWAQGTDVASIFCGNPSQYSMTTPLNGTKSVTGWVTPTTITHTITATFTNAAALTNYFVYGGRILVSPLHSGGTIADVTLSTMFSDSGTLVIFDQGHYATGIGGTIVNGNIGGTNIGETSVSIYNTTDGSPYTSTNYSVSIVANAAPGVATMLTITTLLTVNTAGTISDTYTGTYTSNVQQRNHPTQPVPVFGSILA